MTIDFFGILIYEFDVVITDLLLFAESVLFAYLLYQIKSSRTLARRLLILLFLSLGASSLLGALFHAFFPLKAATTGGFVFWMLVAASIGVTASAIWCINALIFKGQKFLKRILPFVLCYMIIFLYVVIFINYEFKTIILFYALPMAALALISLIKFIHERIYIWAGLLAAVKLSFLAAAVQYLHTGLDPVYFNYNATYHLIQGIALIFLFTAFRSILKNEKI